MPEITYERLPIAGIKDINVFDPATADSAKSLAKFVEGEVTIVAETEMSGAKPNVANGQFLDGEILEFAGQALLSLPLAHGVGELGQILYPSLQTYAGDEGTGFVPTGVAVPSIWLCIEPEGVKDGDLTHIFARVIPATKEHLAKFGNPGNRGAKTNAVQFATTYVHGGAVESLAKGLIAAVPDAAFLTALGWTFVPNPAA